ncbi:hypothetical protein CK503_10265 [Aliifodinibius salipaludis]|uniref:SusC/RagA family TonB-linked outer membrane protein n=1 Tax=Fodinibius salipaludis TaxID=2032627 RepID=A0A2A2G6Z5_9BACT|nr:SusC/RagA family TonB-linked outer membrane protein [Aliifodinibius salipaludis]PAU93536.1 hypothetical protein CK503_10265 [Aliifodinibius salipaludis]
MLKKLLSTLVCTFLFAGAALAQGTITGTVTDGQTGDTLPGVNIQIPSLTMGAATNVDGNFTLEDVPAGTYTVQATFVGYQTFNQEVAVSAGEETTIDIEMQPDVVGLEDVVVTAFGIERDQRALGYGVSEVASEDLESRNQSDVGRALSGQLPGVSISSSGGVTGSGTDINIRGYSSISGSNQPLFIVDGVRFDGGNNASSSWADGGGQQTNPHRLLDIPPSNIKDVSVLKGLSATVLYGEDGRNGVIIIKTKSGSFGEDQEPGFNVTLNQSVYATQISSRPDYQDEYGGGFDQNFGWFYSNWGPRFDTDNPNLFGSDFRGFADDGTVLIDHPLTQHGATAQAFPDLQNADYRYEAKPDPMGSFFRDGLASTSSIGINGGTQDLRLNLNYSRNEEQGFTPNNKLNRNTFSIGAEYSVFSDLTAQTTFNMSLTDVQSPATAAGGGSGPAAAGGSTSVFGDVFYTPRSIDLSIPYQNPQTGGSAYYRSDNAIPHPRWTANNVITTNKTDRYYGKTELNWQAMDRLNVVYTMGYDSYTESQAYMQNAGGIRPEPLNSGFYQTIDIARSTWDHTLNAQFDYQLTEDFTLDGTVGGQYTTESYQRQGVESQNQLIFDFFEHSNFTDQSSTNFFTGADFQRQENVQTAGIYGDFRLGYQDFVYLNLSGRNDWFSTLEPENNSIFYPSVNLSYILSDHIDINSDAITFVKLFGGVATSAGSPDPYSTRTTLATDARSFVNNDGTVITTNATSNFLGNQDLKPELHTEYEAGVDLRFFENRLGLQASAYTRSTTDLITQAPIDPSTGYSSTFVNVGEIENQGLELTINAKPITGGEFQWDVKSNFYTSRSEVVSLGAGLDRIQVGGGFTTRGNFAIEGEPFQVMYGTKIVRVTEEMKQNDPNFSDVEVGTPIINSVGSYQEQDDIGKIGNPNPDWELSLSNTFRYKGASLSFQMDYQQGGDMFSTWISTLLARGLTTTTTKVDRNNTFILPGVNEQGQPNNVQISPSSVFFDNFGFGTDEMRVYDMTHIRLTNVRLGYDLPASVLESTPFSQVTISVTGDNLWMYAFNVPEASGFDPNVNSIGGNSRGFEYLTGPAARRFGGSVTLRF